MKESYYRNGENVSVNEMKRLGGKVWEEKALLPMTY